MCRREPLNSKRIIVINHQISEIHMGVADLSENLIDRDPVECIKIIEAIKEKLSALKDQVINGHITKKYKHR